MKATSANHTLFWNPGTDQVLIVPSRGAHDLYYGKFTMHDFGTCSFSAHARALERAHYVLATALALIVRHGCDIKAVHREFMKLDEYANGPQ